MLKILWVGDYMINSGFSQVSHNICMRLAKQCQVVIYAINYDGGSLDPRLFKVYPAINKLSYDNPHQADIYGFNGINPVIGMEKPDITILFNDLGIVNKYLDTITEPTQVVTLFPVNNLPIIPEHLLRLSIKPNKVIKAITYTNWARNECMKINPTLDPLTCYHGVDKGAFYSITKTKQAMGIPENSFVVGCVNTNSVRKRLDLTLRGFAEFAKNKEDVYLLLHCAHSHMPYNLVDLATRLNILRKVIFSSAVLTVPQLNVLYNAMDLNVSTTTGEGFGLPLVEGAACKVPILCTDLPALRDIWGDSAEYIKVRDIEILPFENYDGAMIDLEDYTSKLEKFYSDVEYRQKMQQKAYTATFDSRLDWDKITDKILDSILKSYHSGVKVLE